MYVPKCFQTNITKEELIKKMKNKEDFVKFAIEFNKWVDELRSSEIDTIDYDMYLNNDMDELLEIFKKEKKYEDYNLF
jgi:hypothetical protein